MIHSSNNYIPFYLRKLKGVDLSDGELINANLGGADLSNANLERANLLNARLVTADLSGAKLSKSDIGFADLSGTQLQGSTLTGADLEGSILFQADLSNADLSGSRLVMANLYSTNLSNSLLIGLNIRTHIPEGAKIQFGFGSFSVNIPIDPILPYVFIHDTDFSNAIIDSKEDVKYFRKNGGRNVPRAITNKMKLAKKLRERNLDENRITELLSHSSLS